MDTEDLSAALRAATATIETRPDFTEKVQRGARRRLVRRRYRICAAVLAVLAIGGGLTALSSHLKPVAVTTHPTSKLPSDDPRLHDATRGDLAKNQSFLDQAGSVWQRDVAAPRDVHEAPGGTDSVEVGPLGPINVYWAGNTPDGPAAVLLQAFSLRSIPGGQPPSTVVEIGVVATSSRGPLSLTGQETVGATIDDASSSFAFGADNTTVLTMIESGDHVYSATPTVNPSTGKVGRQWRNLPYVDGVAVIDIGAEHGNGLTMAELPDPAHPYLPASRDRPLASDDWTANPDHRLAWPMTTVVGSAPGGAPGTNPPSWSATFDTALRDGGYSDLYLERPITVSADGVSKDSLSPWHIVCQVENGKILILGEELDGPAGSLYAVTVDHNAKVLSVAYGGPIDPISPLPVRYRLPDGAGWLLAAYGSHLSAGDRDDSNVLTVPASASTVTVTPQDGSPHTIQLGS